MTFSISKPPLNTFGNFHNSVSHFRASRPLSLTWKNCRRNGFKEWKKEARQTVIDALHYNPGVLNLKPKIISKVETKDFIGEKILYNSAPWFEIPAYFLLPKIGKPPYPAIYLMHEWGGNILFGKERVIQFGNEHPILVEHQQLYHSGKGLANEFTKRGYAVLVADAFYFGERGPRGFEGILDDIDPYKLSLSEVEDINVRIKSTLYLALRYLMWAGTTWAGINTWDDMRGIDYLLSCPEVDPERIACTGLSGGGWRTNFLAALDDRIKASASIMWMTTGDALHDYNVAGAVGTFCMIPGLWQKLDIPDLSVMAAPNAAMVVSGTNDILFSHEGQTAAAKDIEEGFAWAGCPSQFSYYNPTKPHCFDAEIQQVVLDWFDKHLK